MFNLIKGLALLVAATFLISVLALPVYKAYGTDQTVTAVVTKTETKRGTSEDKYLIFTEGEVFENTDSLLRLKFNSSDVYGQIAAGKTCTFLVNGWRFPIFSMYRNVLEANCG